MVQLLHKIAIDIKCHDIVLHEETQATQLYPMARKFQLVEFPSTEYRP